jgi:HEAT repeat protein
VPVLKNIPAADLVLEIEGMGTAAVRRREEEITLLLRHRDPMVRLAAARALGSAGRGAAELRSRLTAERNPLVLSEICDSLSLLKDRESLPVLHRLFEEHRSRVVREYALLALADTEGRSAIPYLQERLRTERSPSLRSLLSCLLMTQGVGGALTGVTKALRSRDFRLRHRTANTLAHYAPKIRRPELLAALRDAAGREAIPGVREDLERAIRAMS